MLPIIHHLLVYRFDGLTTPLISHAIFYVKVLFITSAAYSSFYSLGWFNKSSLYFEAPSVFFLEISMVCLLVESITSLSVSERSITAAFTFLANIRLLNFLAISSVDVGLF